MRARLALAAGDAVPAIALTEQAISSARSEHGSDPIVDRFRIAAGYRLLGEAKKQAGDVQGAQKAWSEGLAQLPADETLRPSEMDEKAQLLQHVGRAGEARPAVSRRRAPVRSSSG